MDRLVIRHHGCYYHFATNLLSCKSYSEIDMEEWALNAKEKNI